mmetsp:Transcript_6066/g.21270  ORF Transcript_6066/g.21270 Transcript_6066/m.21270 type:complete len:409 (-) Transcript_6066:342-1568(-)
MSKTSELVFGKLAAFPNRSRKQIERSKRSPAIRVNEYCSSRALSRMMLLDASTGPALTNTLSDESVPSNAPVPASTADTSSSHTPAATAPLTVTLPPSLPTASSDTFAPPGATGTTCSRGRAVAPSIRLPKRSRQFATTAIGSPADIRGLVSALDANMLTSSAACTITDTTASSDASLPAASKSSSALGYLPAMVGARPQRLYVPHPAASLALRFEKGVTSRSWPALGAGAALPHASTSTTDTASEPSARASTEFCVVPPCTDAPVGAPASTVRFVPPTAVPFTLPARCHVPAVTSRRLAAVPPPHCPGSPCAATTSPLASCEATSVSGEAAHVSLAAVAGFPCASRRSRCTSTASPAVTVAASPTPSVLCATSDGPAVTLSVLHARASALHGPRPSAPPPHTRRESG